MAKYFALAFERRGDRYGVVISFGDAGGADAEEFLEETDLFRRELEKRRARILYEGDDEARAKQSVSGLKEFRNAIDRVEGNKLASLVGATFLDVLEATARR